MIKLNYPKFWHTKNWISTLLLPLSWIYTGLSILRKAIVTPIKLPAFVICVGNMTVGGSGKTQIVKWLSQHLKDDHKILIITKGYHSKLQGAKLINEKDSAEDVGDESKLLACYAPVIAAKSLKAALPLIKHLKPEIIIFDDGMQNPGFIKDLTILSVNLERGIGNGRIFPAGPLRQSAESAIKISDMAVLIKGDRRDNLLPTKWSIPTFDTQIKATDLISEVPYFAFAGIGNPDSFFNLLKATGADLKKTKPFPDHHNYSQNDVKEMENTAQKLGLKLITTEKDYVKLNSPKNIEYLQVDLAFSSNQQNQLLKLIYTHITKRK